jgi:homoserine/homoserine lactone efflux protein
MDLHLWFGYSAVALVAVLSPGPAVLLAVTNSTNHGVAAAFYSTLGNILGLVLLASASILGLGLILQSSAFLFAAVKLIGACYLIYLGIKTWRSSNAFSSPRSISPDRGRRRRTLFLEAIGMAVTNPKPILFFTAVFPQFIDIARPVAPQFFALTLTFVVYSFCALMSYAWFASSIRHFARETRVNMWFSRISGGCFMVFGTGLLLLKRPQG